LARSLYHSSPLVLPRPSDIAFCWRYIWNTQGWNENSFFHFSRRNNEILF
jgi:hypothetical protein